MGPRPSQNPIQVPKAKPLLCSINFGPGHGLCYAYASPSGSSDSPCRSGLSRCSSWRPPGCNASMSLAAVRLSKVVATISFSAVQCSALFAWLVPSRSQASKYPKGLPFACMFADCFLHVAMAAASVLCRVFTHFVGLMHLHSAVKLLNFE